MEVRIHKYRVIGTTVDIYEAYTPTELMSANGHSTLYQFPGDSRWWGKIGTEHRLPPEFESLPANSDHRMNAVTGWYASRYALAIAYIHALCPETISAKGSRTRRGSVEVSEQT